MDFYPWVGESPVEEPKRPAGNWRRGIRKLEEIRKNKMLSAIS